MSEAPSSKSKKTSLDRIDRKILRILQSNARIPNKELASLVNLSPTPCLRRVALLKEAGYITRFKAVLCPSSLNLGIRSFMSVKRSRDSDQEGLAQKLAAFPEVISCHIVSGEYDFLLEIIAKDMNDYSNLLLERIGKMEGVYDARSVFSIKTLKTDGDLPIRE